MTDLLYSFFPGMTKTEFNAILDNHEKKSRRKLQEIRQETQDSSTATKKEIKGKNVVRI